MHHTLPILLCRHKHDSRHTVAHRTHHGTDRRSCPNTSAAGEPDWRGSVFAQRLAIRLKEVSRTGYRPRIYINQDAHEQRKDCRTYRHRLPGNHTSVAGCLRRDSTANIHWDTQRVYGSRAGRPANAGRKQFGLSGFVRADHLQLRHRRAGPHATETHYAETDTRLANCTCKQFHHKRNQ